MNFIDAYVREILSEPYCMYAHWWVDVRVESYGRESTTELMFHNKEDAEKVHIGQKVLV